MPTFNAVLSPSATPAELSVDLADTLKACYLPELGKVYRGKVRDCHTFVHEQGPDKPHRRLRALIATDRISAFDRVFEQTIPGKGAVLNLLAAHFLEQAAAICPTHLVDVPDPNVTIAKELAPIPVEVVVRAYLTGSAWRDYQEGVFETRYGFALPAGLPVNARLAVPIVTPTNKAHEGHDQPLTPSQAARLAGGDEAWSELCRIALALFAQGTQLAADRGLILVDTKYEFGLDDGVLTLMDEVHTPDSSRYWYQASYASDPAHPEQLSKEFLRDWLRDRGFSGDGPVPPLTDEVRLEVARRYRQIFELLTGRAFWAQASETRLPIPERIVRNLKASGYLSGTFVAILMGSASDRPVGDRVAVQLADLGIPSRLHVVSAHKVPDKLHQLVCELNTSSEPVVAIAIAGRSNGLGGATAANSVHPVISLPAFADRADYLINIHSSLQMPGDTPALVVIEPANAALAAARMLGLADRTVADRVALRMEAVRAAFVLDGDEPQPGPTQREPR